MTPARPRPAGRANAERNPPREILITAPRHRCLDYKECYHLRELDVRILQCIANGLTRNQTATKLGYSPHTIKNRLTGLHRLLRTSKRLGRSGAAQLVVRAHQLRIITIPQDPHPPPVIVTERGG
jgi:DNA-binding CsgD family transcriptional regulator